MTRSAEEQRIKPAELLRDLMRAHLADRERRALEAGARRQSLAIAARAGGPDSDDAQVMREIEGRLGAQEAGRDDEGGDAGAGEVPGMP